MGAMSWQRLQFFCLQQKYCCCWRCGKRSGSLISLTEAAEEAASETGSDPAEPVAGVVQEWMLDIHQGPARGTGGSDWEDASHMDYSVLGYHGVPVSEFFWYGQYLSQACRSITKLYYGVHWTEASPIKTAAWKFQQWYLTVWYCLLNSDPTSTNDGKIIVFQNPLLFGNTVHREKKRGNTINAKLAAPDVTEIKFIPMASSVYSFAPC
jgi:hypothetical protein